MGAARNATLGTARSTHPLDLHLRRHLSGARNRRRPRPAALQHHSDGAASGRDLPNGDAGSPCRCAARSGRMAPLRQARHSCQHYPDAAAAKVARTQSGRKHLAVHARQLALQSRLPLLRRDPRALLLRLEPAPWPSCEQHVERTAPLGISVLISGIWYKLTSESNHAKETKPDTSTKSTSQS